MATSTETTSQYLTADSFCQLAGISRSTLGRWKQLGLIPYVQPAGKRGRLLFPANALEACQKLQSIPATRPLESAGSQPSKLRGRRPKWAAGAAEESPIQQ